MTIDTNEFDDDTRNWKLVKTLPIPQKFSKYIEELCDVKMTIYNSLIDAISKSDLSHSGTWDLDFRHFLKQNAPRIKLKPAPGEDGRFRKVSESDLPSVKSLQEIRKKHPRGMVIDVHQTSNKPHYFATCQTKQTFIPSHQDFVRKYVLGSYPIVFFKNTYTGFSGSVKNTQGMPISIDWDLSGWPTEESTIGWSDKKRQRYALVFIINPDADPSLRTESEETSAPYWQPMNRFS